VQPGFTLGVSLLAARCSLLAARCSRSGVLIALTHARSFKKMGITFGNVLSYNALLDMCAMAANQHTTNFGACSRLSGMLDDSTRLRAGWCVREDQRWRSQHALRVVYVEGKRRWEEALTRCGLEAAAANYALSVLETMRENKVRPNAETYSALLRSCCQSR
jgi:hypothetical protein